MFLYKNSVKGRVSRCGMSVLNLSQVKAQLNDDD